jgi:hypothetical protein
MIYKIGSQKLDITNSEAKEDKGSPNQIVPWRDVAETCRTLDAVCNCITTKDTPAIVDGIARAGFWGAVFRNKWPHCSLHLNERKVNCLSVLERNFPDDTITSFDITSWTPRKCDVVLLDFDHFTLRILNEWESVLMAWEKSCTHFIIADGACFGFKFGNMRHYGITTEEEYYYLLNDALKKIINKRITVVSKFINAATILLEDTASDKIKFVPPSSQLFLSKGNKSQLKGFFDI